MLFTRRFTLDNGTEVEVDGAFRFENVNNIEITDYKAWRYEDRNDVNAPYVELTEAEDFRLYEEMMADDSIWGYDDG